jgi:hypothetical protein
MRLQLTHRVEIFAPGHTLNRGAILIQLPVFDSQQHRLEKYFDGYYDPEPNLGSY